VAAALCRAATGTGTRYRILTRVSDDHGSHVAAEVLIRPGAPGFYPRLPGSMPLHSHKGAEEVVVVAEGRLGYTLGGDMRSAAAGDTVTIPAGEGGGGAGRPCTTAGGGPGAADTHTHTHTHTHTQ
jgi:hypothetical protein